MFTGDPFSEPFEVAQGSSNVIIVTTLNCDGQTTVYEVGCLHILFTSIVAQIFPTGHH